MQKKFINKSFLFLLLILLTGGKMFAQRTLIDVKVDSAAILIGEQTVLHLTVTTDKDKPVQIVIPSDTLMRGVEVLELSEGRFIRDRERPPADQAGYPGYFFRFILVSFATVQSDRRSRYYLFKPDCAEGFDHSRECG